MTEQQINTYNMGTNLAKATHKTFSPFFPVFHMIMHYESLGSNQCSSQSLEKHSQAVWEIFLYTNYSITYL